MLNKFSDTRILAKMAFISYKEMVFAKFLWGNVLLGGKLEIDVKNSNFDIFNSALYMKSVSMPLRTNCLYCLVCLLVFFVYLFCFCFLFYLVEVLSAF